MALPEAVYDIWEFITWVDSGGKQQSLQITGQPVPPGIGKRRGCQVSTSHDIL